MLAMKRLDQRGFTLPELFVATGLIVLLMVPAFFLLHPKDFGAQQRNAQRRLDAAHLLQAINAYQKDNGKLPASITTKPALIGSAQGAANICADLLPRYLKIMPNDPLVRGGSLASCNKADADYVTGYAISKSSDGVHVTVLATLAEHATVGLTH